MAKSVLGEMIAKYRKEARLTQEELGKMVGVSTQAVSRWECGGTPDMELLPVIADYLHVSIDALYGRDAGDVVDVKELVYRKIRNAPQEECIDLLLEYVWAMQQAAQINGMPEIEPAYTMLSVEVVDRSQDENPWLIPSSILLCDERSCMLHGLVKDKRFAAILPEPEGGFEATLKHPEEYVRLFELLAKPHYLDMLIDVNRRKPKEYFTVRSAAVRLNIPEEEAKSILEELEHHMMLDGMEVADEEDYVFLNHFMMNPTEYYHYEIGKDVLEDAITPLPVLVYLLRDGKLVLLAVAANACLTPVGCCMHLFLYDRLHNMVKRRIRNVVSYSIMLAAYFGLKSGAEEGRDALNKFPWEKNKAFYEKMQKQMWLPI